ncbi:glycosyltransferase family 4 protein [Olivibacter ginsenosidimutans]|uniref:Glycosyltransferase family 4 protein n=2 Tax=Olivibacter ginsenosidimutans TaxID=1176537 RepID=A0ABP9ASM9_9SPHI
MVDYTLPRGGERVTATLANCLSEKDEVHIISLYQGQPTPFFSFHSDIHIHVLHADRNINPNFFAKLKRKWTELYRLKGVLKSLDLACCIGVGSYPSTLLGILRRWYPSAVSYWAWEHSNYFALSSIWRYLRLVAYKKLTGVVCITQADAELYQRKFKRVVFIPNVIEPVTSIPDTHKKKQVLAIGALEKEKGFDLLIEAFSFVKKQAADWSLLLVGEGSEASFLQNMVAEKGLQSFVEFLPNQKNLGSIFAQSSIYVLPSRREGFGMVILEAMSYGLPCISFDCPVGPASIIRHQENGLLVQAGDVHQLAQTIVCLLNDKPLQDKLVQAGFHSVQQYWPEQVVPIWLSLFKQRL